MFSGDIAVMEEAERTAAAAAAGNVRVAAARAKTRRKTLLDEDRYMSAEVCFTVRVDSTVRTDRRGVVTVGREAPANIN